MKYLFLCVMVLGLCISYAGADVSNYKMIDLGTMGGISSIAQDVNDLGQVVGVVYKPLANNPDYYTTFVWKSGTLTQLNYSGMKNMPKGINNKGQVVGQVALDDGYLHAYTWQSGNTTLLFDYCSAAYGINDNGQMVGFVHDTQPGGINGAYLLENGVTRIIGPGWAYGINNLGQIVGEMSPTGTSQIAGSGFSLSMIIASDQRNRGFLWNKGRVVDLNSYFGADYIYPYDINDSGQIVGEALVNGKNFYFLSQGNRLIEFSSPIYGISNNGVIAGSYLQKDGTYHAVLWQPLVPEPAAFVALLSGLGSFGMMLFKRRR